MNLKQINNEIRKLVTGKISEEQADAILTLMDIKMNSFYDKIDDIKTSMNNQIKFTQWMIGISMAITIALKLFA